VDPCSPRTRAPGRARPGGLGGRVDVGAGGAHGGPQGAGRAPAIPGTGPSILAGSDGGDALPAGAAVDGGGHPGSKPVRPRT
jgi:hypothetical protein